MALKEYKPGTAFNGVIGRTFDVSSPAWPQPLRAKRRSVHVAEAQTVRGQRIDVRRLDRAAVAPHLAEASIVLHDKQDVGRTFLCAQWLWPCGAGYIECSTDHPVECGSRFVLF